MPETKKGPVFLQPLLFSSIIYIYISVGTLISETSKYLPIW